MTHQDVTGQDVSPKTAILSLQDEAGISPALIQDALCYEDLIEADRHAWREPIHLYRYYDADGGLLYVGRTFDFLRRDHQHQVADWRWDAASVTLELFPSRSMADLAERTAINLEQPAVNVLKLPHSDFYIPRDEWFFAKQGRRLIGCRPARLEIDGPYFVGLTLYGCAFTRNRKDAE